MAIFANIKLKDGCMLDPFLAKLVDKLALDYPEYTFRTHGTGTKEQASFTSPVQSPSPVPLVAGNKFLRLVEVFAGSERMGEISVDTRWRRYNGDVVYQLRSWRIQKSRRRDVELAQTAKCDAAIREFKQSFSPKNYDELMDRAGREIARGYSQAIYALTRLIDHGVMVPDLSKLQHYIFMSLGTDTAREMDPVLKKEVEAAVTSDKYHKAMREYKLALNMTNRKMVYIARSGEGFVLLDAEKQHRCFQFEELPERRQEQLAVLQLMVDGELVNDVGFRHNADQYCVID